MATNSRIEVSSAVLTELKDSLTDLSNALHNIYEFLYADMVQCGEVWQDGKYQEFVEGYKPQIDKCQVISDRYAGWCSRVLDPEIERSIEIENAKVGGEDSFGKVGAGLAATSALASGVGAARHFNGIGNNNNTFRSLDKDSVSLIRETAPFIKNNTDIANSLGIKVGTPMTIAEADMQKSNPHYGESDEYGVNCATVVNAYALRLRGLDVTAKGNPKAPLRHWYDINTDSNYWVSQRDNVFKVWKNTDGSKANPNYAAEWMKNNNIKSMSEGDYRKYFEETCKEKGVYILSLSWKDGSEHATILQRDDDGKLYFVEPQVYERDRTSDGRRDIGDLLSHNEGMSMNPRSFDGILRVDDKIFNHKYADMFDVNKI